MHLQYKQKDLSSDPRSHAGYGGKHLYPGAPMTPDDRNATYPVIHNSDQETIWKGRT